MEMGGLLHASAALPPVKLDRRLGENQNRNGQGGEEKDVSHRRSKNTNVWVLKKLE
jgi:hypothetical protein